MKFLNQKKNRTKILHIITSLTGGGAQQVLFKLISNSIRLDDKFEHEVLNLSKGGFYYNKLENLGIKITNVGIPKGNFSFKYIFKIIKFLKKNDSNIIQTWMYHADFLGGILAKIFTKKKIIWNIRSSNLDWSLNRWHTVLIAKISGLLSYFIPNMIVSNSNKAITYHVKQGYCKKKFELIFNGFDCNLIKPDSKIRKKLRDKYNIEDDEIVIGNIARWDVQKGHNFLLEAVSKLKHSNIVLFLIGENMNDQNQDLTDLIRYYELKNIRIILKDQTSSIYDYLNIFDISVISSVGESFPNAIPECMLMELPIVTTKVGDIPDVVNKKIGWSCNPNSSSKLNKIITNAIDEFNNNKFEWNKKKKNCRKKVINFFDINGMSLKYNFLWKQIINDEEFSKVEKFKKYQFKDSKKLRVCHIISSMSHGGAQQVLARILRSDKTINHEIISLSNLGRYGQEIANEGHNIICLDMNKYTLNLKKIIQLYKIIKSREENVVIQTWMYHADLIGGLIGYFLNKKVYWNIRNSDLNVEWSSHITIIIQKICSLLSKKIPNKILSCSERAAKIHIKIGYDKSKFSVIDNGFNLSEIRFDNDLRNNFRSKYDIQKDEFIFGMVARWDPQKDFDSLIKSIELFYNNNDDLNVRFFLAGPNILNSNIDLIKMMKSSIRDKIVLVGNIRHVTNFMNGIDCHILSSAGNEGFPNVIGEAMACELPCICTDVGDISKLIYDKNWIVPTKSPQILAHKMKEIYNLYLNKNIIFNKIKKDNREHILNNFEIKKMVNSYYSNWI